MNIERKALKIRAAKVEDFHSGQRVEYVDFDGTGDPGTVSSKNSVNVFVRFDKHVAKLGWDGATSQACNPNDLHVIPP